MPQITIDPAITALLLMDVTPYEDGLFTHSPAWQQSVKVLPALLAAARRQGLLVVHARATGDPLASHPHGLHQTPSSADASAGLTLPPPMLGEPVVDTAECPSLQRKQLERILVSGGIRSLVLAGLTDAVHVDHVLAPLLEGGYRCLLVRDLCICPEPAASGSTLELLMGKMDGRAMVADSAEILAALRSPDSAQTGAARQRLSSP